LRDWTIETLSCPSCRRGYTLSIDEQTADEIIEGQLTCPGCAVEIPIRAGFAMFTAAGIAGQSAGGDLIEQRDYEAYRAQKARRGEIERYAAFHPFNEGVRAADVLIPRFAAHLSPGALILDPWSRTGWSAAWLAARFPQQRIVALWEGDRSVLGYSGFDYWFGVGKKPSNLDILFVEPDHGLPFADDVFAGLYAHDCWHRFSPMPFWADCLRVTTAEAPMVLAHTHLSNSVPDPWFDRGCVIRHGRDYRRWLDSLLADDQRDGWVWSEVDLFHVVGGDALPQDSPDSTHYYNALIFIADPAKAPVAEARDDGDLRLLVNPLFRIDFAGGTASVDGRLYDGLVGGLLDRHPAYRAHLPQQRLHLTKDERLAIALAVTGHSIADIRAAIGDAAPTPAMIAADLLLPTPVAGRGIEMQRFHALQLPPPGSAATFLEQPWQRDDLALRSSDGGEIRGAELRALFDAMVAALRDLGAGPGRGIACAVGDHPLALLICLATLACGGDAWLSSAAQPGAADLVISADSQPVRDGAVALGLDGAAGSLIDRLSAATRGDSWIALGGDVVFRSGDRLVRIAGNSLIEAALSLQAASAVGDLALASLDHGADLLACLVTLAHGGAIRLG
jgi:uncharacterized protein YbaR (Trm112 family)